MTLPVCLPLHLELNSTRDRGVGPVAQNVVNDRVVLLRLFILVKVIHMLGVLEVHVLARDIRNTVFHLCYMPGLEFRGTRLDEKVLRLPLLAILPGVYHVFVR